MQLESLTAEFVEREIPEGYSSRYFRGSLRTVERRAVAAYAFRETKARSFSSSHDCLSRSEAARRLICTIHQRRTETGAGAAPWRPPRPEETAAGLTGRRRYVDAPAGCQVNDH